MKDVTLQVSPSFSIFSYHVLFWCLAAFVPLGLAFVLFLYFVFWKGCNCFNATRRKVRCPPLYGRFDQITRSSNLASCLLSVLYCSDHTLRTFHLIAGFAASALGWSTVLGVLVTCMVAFSMLPYCFSRW